MKLFDTQESTDIAEYHNKQSHSHDLIKNSTKANKGIKKEEDGGQIDTPKKKHKKDSKIKTNKALKEFYNKRYTVTAKTLLLVCLIITVAFGVFEMSFVTKSLPKFFNFLIGFITPTFVMIIPIIIYSLKLKKVYIEDRKKIDKSFYLYTYIGCIISMILDCFFIYNVSNLGIKIISSVIINILGYVAMLFIWFLINEQPYFQKVELTREEATSGTSKEVAIEKLRTSTTIKFPKNTHDGAVFLSKVKIQVESGSVEEKMFV